MTEMTLRFCESEIGYWAERYTDRQREANRQREEQLGDLKAEIQARGYMTKDELHQIALWKSHRRASPHFAEHRRFCDRNHHAGFHSHRRLGKIVIFDRVTRYRRTDCLCNSAPI